MPQTIARLRISITGVDYALAPLEHVDHLKGVIIEAVRLGGGFVDLTLDDGQRLSVLVTPTTHIVIAAQTVPLHALSADSDPQLGCLPVDPAADEDDWPYDLILTAGRTSATVQRTDDEVVGNRTQRHVRTLRYFPC